METIGVVILVAVFVAVWLVGVNERRKCERRARRSQYGSIVNRVCR